MISKTDLVFFSSHIWSENILEIKTIAVVFIANIVDLI